MPITYLTGDATDPVKRPALIMHCCNNVGAWGAGFVLALSRRWPEPEAAYRRMNLRPLGKTQFVSVAGDEVVVANIIGQLGLRLAGGQPPVRYDALENGFRRVKTFLDQNPAYSVHAPRLGCGLAGGEWPRVEGLIVVTRLDAHDVFIYDLPGAS